MADCFALLTSLNLLGAMVCPFTNSMDLWFYGVMLLTMETAIWLKTQNMTMVSVTTVLYGTAIAALLPLEVKYIAYMIMVFGLTPALYNVMKRKR